MSFSSNIHPYCSFKCSSDKVHSTNAFRLSLISFFILHYFAASPQGSWKFNVFQTFVVWAGMWSRTHRTSLSSCPQTWSSASCSSTTTQASPGQACPTLPTPPIPPAKRAPPSTPSRPPTGKTAAARPGRPATNRSTCTQVSCRVLACMLSVFYTWPVF